MGDTIVLDISSTHIATGLGINYIEGDTILLKNIAAYNNITGSLYPVNQAQILNNTAI